MMAWRRRTQARLDHGFREDRALPQPRRFGECRRPFAASTTRARAPSSWEFTRLDRFNTPGCRCTLVASTMPLYSLSCPIAGPAIIFDVRPAWFERGRGAGLLTITVIAIPERPECWQQVATLTKRAESYRPSISSSARRPVALVPYLDVES